MRSGRSRRMMYSLPFIGLRRGLGSHEIIPILSVFLVTDPFVLLSSFISGEEQLSRMRSAPISYSLSLLTESSAVRPLDPH